MRLLVLTLCLLAVGPGSLTHARPAPAPVCLTPAQAQSLVEQVDVLVERIHRIDAEITELQELQREVEAERQRARAR